MQVMRFSLAALAAAFLLSGCTAKPIIYPISDRNIEILKNRIEDSHTVDIGDVTVSEHVGNYLMCRLTTVPMAPHKKILSAYIKAGLQEEFLLAGVLGDGAGSALDLDVRNITLDTLSNSRWEMSFRVSSPYYHGYTVSVTQKFPNNLFAAAVCNNASKAFKTAMQEMFLEIYTHPDFNKLIGMDADKTSLNYR